MFARTLSPKALLPFAAGAALGLVCFFAGTEEASAQVYVYAPAPPPPRYGYAYAREPEPPNMLMIAADVEGAIPVNLPVVDGNTIQGGGGFKIRVGERMRLGYGVHFTPEVGYAYDHLFASDDNGDPTYDWEIQRFFAGARLSFGSVVVPVVYAHAGYGWRNTGDPTVPSNGGLAYDVGGALDFRRFRHVAVGVHVEYAGVDLQPYSPQWVALGAHLELTL